MDVDADGITDRRWTNERLSISERRRLLYEELRRLRASGAAAPSERPGSPASPRADAHRAPGEQGRPE